jgi:DNA-binding response OmpR family regulator
MYKAIIHDTEKDIQKLMRIALQLEGFNVCPITDSDDDFLSIINESRRRVVVDCRTDGSACLETLKKIKNKYTHLPVITTSCNTNIGDGYSQYGFDVYIPKPFDMGLLYTTLRKHTYCQHRRILECQGLKYASSAAL